MTNCHGLKMTAADGKKRMTDVVTTEQLLLSIRVRNALTDEWQKNGVQQGREYAILTDEITKAWSGMSTRQYKNLKGLKIEEIAATSEEKKDEWEDVIKNKKNEQATTVSVVKTRFCITLKKG